jgi:hypothetical protein
MGCSIPTRPPDDVRGHGDGARGMIGRGHKGRTDASHKFWREWFRAHGVQWQDTSVIGRGCPDAVVGIGNKWGAPMPRDFRMAWVEVKDPKGKLTDDQVEFHKNWRVFIVSDEPSAKDVLNWLKT